MVACHFLRPAVILLLLTKLALIHVRDLLVMFEVVPYTLIAQYEYCSRVGCCDDASALRLCTYRGSQNVAPFYSTLTLVSAPAHASLVYCCDMIPARLMSQPPWVVPVAIGWLSLVLGHAAAAAAGGLRLGACPVQGRIVL